MRARVWLSLVVVTACSRDGGKPASSPVADTGGMADMPGMGTPTDVTLTAAQIAHGGVHWEPVAASTVAPVGTVPGQVIPNEDRTARLGATVRGRVIAVRVRPGDRVSAGRVLVTLQSPEAGMAQSDVEKARAQASYARSARRRAERLLALKAIPQQDYDRAIADDELASAELRRARSVAEQIGAAASATGVSRRYILGPNRRRRRWARSLHAHPPDSRRDSEPRRPAQTGDAGERLGPRWRRNVGALRP